MRANTVRPYESKNLTCPHANKPNLKAPLSKGSRRRKASEGLFSFVFVLAYEKTILSSVTPLATYAKKSSLRNNSNHSLN